MAESTESGLDLCTLKLYYTESRVQVSMVESTVDNVVPRLGVRGQMHKSIMVRQLPTTAL